MESKKGFIQNVPRPLGTKPSDVYKLDASNLFRLKLGKTETEFFSTRGNRRLKRIWLENDLDKEMIFASWIGPSRALLRNKVSDHLQAFVMRRAQFLSYCNAEMFAILAGLNDIRCSQISSKYKDRHPHFNKFVKETLENNYKEREMQEKARVANSIANEDLSMIPGFEYIKTNPVFKAIQIETRMRNLKRIPIPYNEEEFQIYIYPLVLSTVTTSNPKVKKAKTRSSKVPKTNSLPSVVETELQSSSGFFEMTSRTSSETSVEDNGLIQAFSEMDLTLTDLNTNLSESICDCCGGLTDDKINATNANINCSCLSNPMWDRTNEQTATALYHNASKIIETYQRKQKICSKYMAKYKPVMRLSTA